VLDPFCGRGTTPFQSLLMKRNTIANDINPVAYCITRAKSDAPQLETVLVRLDELESNFNSLAENDIHSNVFFHWCFHGETLDVLSYLRSALDWQTSEVDCMIAALALGSLHGDVESGSYFSNQMPRTIATKPQYSVRYWQERRLSPPFRDVFRILKNKAGYRYSNELPTQKGTVILGDMRNLPRELDEDDRSIRCVITSPPYLNTTSFEEDQWLRLWFLGGPPYPTRGEVSPDDRYESRDKYWSLIADMWRMLGKTVDSSANIVIRLGVKGMTPGQIVDSLEGVSVVARRTVKVKSFSVSEIRRRQTASFRPGSVGLLREVDCHFLLK
jgi:hypothetical protein